MRLSKVIEAARNELVFHFDESAMRAWGMRHPTGNILWAEGRGATAGEIVYSASLDAAIETVLRGGEPSNPQSNHVRELLAETMRAMNELAEFLDRAIFAYLDQVEPTGLHRQT